MWPNPQETADMLTFSEEIFNRRLHFLCSAINYVQNWIQESFTIQNKALYG